VPDGDGEAGSPRFRCWVSVVLALPVLGLVSAEARPQGAEGAVSVFDATTEMEFERIAARFERVVREPVDVTLPVAAQAAVVPSRAMGMIDDQPPRPRLKPREGDRSGEVIALLHDVATQPVQPSAALMVAQEDASAVGSDAPPEEAAIEVLRGELKSRDAVIADLLKRVEQLESRLVLTAAQLDQAVAGQSEAGEPMPLVRQPTPEPAAPVAQAPPAAPSDAQGSPETEAQAPAQPAAPGQFEVDEEAVDRALERTLVQEGVLLLPFGQAEIEPSFNYTRREVDFPTVFNGFVAEQKVRRNEFESAATLRVGLPFDSQVEVAVPYNYVDQSVVNTVNGTPQDHDDETGDGFGDVSVGLAKTLLRESGGGWWPDLVARVTWDADTGKTEDKGVFLGGGFNEVAGSLTAVKRQDPLAFVAGASYAKTFENNNFEPGDELGFSLGTVLAASPETSLSFFFNQTFADDSKFDGENIDGSDQVIGTLSIGAATILGRNVLLSITGDVGLTDDAPDYAIGAALPIRFDMPFF
jgi:hypothetical protein